MYGVSHEEMVGYWTGNLLKYFLWSPQEYTNQFAWLPPPMCHHITCILLCPSSDIYIYIYIYTYIYIYIAEELHKTLANKRTYVAGHAARCLPMQPQAILCLLYTSDAADE